MHYTLAANRWLVAMAKKNKNRDFLFLRTYFFRHFEIRCSQGLKKRKWLAISIVWHCNKGCRGLRGLVVVTKEKPALFFAHIVGRFRHGHGTKAVGMKRFMDASYTNIWYRNNCLYFSASKLSLSIIRCFWQGSEELPLGKTILGSIAIFWAVFVMATEAKRLEWLSRWRDAIYANIVSWYRHNCFIFLHNQAQFIDHQRSLTR